MTRKITIQDISKAAGTSPSTVSRVLTGNASVSQEKREAIEDAIKRLKYRPSHLARGLKTSITYSVGLLLNDITNPFYSAIARGVEDVALEHGYSLILCNTSEDPSREIHYLQVLQDKHVDGVIVGPTKQNEDFLQDYVARIPVVQVDRQLKGLPLSSVVADNEDAGYTATRHMLERGHRRIHVFCWGWHVSSLNERLNGYKRALNEYNIPFDPTLIIDVEGHTIENACRAAETWFTNGTLPVAVLALNNQLGLGILKAAHALELSIPDQLALVVFDDQDVFALLRPSITAVEQPAYAIGRRAMELLLERMDSDEAQPPQVVVLPMQLIERESV
jgi:LacI family transcriptional regulator